MRTFNGAPNGERSVAAHIMREPAPLSILLLFFMQFIALLVVETNRYYYQFLDNSDNGPSSHREVTRAEMFMFLALTVQMRHAVQGRLEDYWTKLEQFCCPIYRQMMVHARYYHILCFLHFTDNTRNGADRIDDRLWKI